MLMKLQLLSYSGESSHMMIAFGLGSREKKKLKTTIILESIKKGDSILWKKVINYIKYIGFELKWCIGNEEKVCFSIDFWVYISPFIFFVDENYFYCINWDTKVYNFINFPKCFSKC